MRLRAKENDFISRCAKSFETLVGLLAVINGGGKAMKLQKRVSYELWFAPSSGLDIVMGFNVPVDCDSGQFGY